MKNGTPVDESWVHAMKDTPYTNLLNGNQKGTFSQLYQWEISRILK